MQWIIAESTEAGVQTISSANACEIVLGSHSMQTVNLKNGELVVMCHLHVKKRKMR